MEFDRSELIDQLKMEILVLERGGYQPSVHTPRDQPRFIRDAVGCPNFTLEQAQVQCHQCLWSAFVPPEHLQKENACQYIPLNAEGDTIASLEASGRRADVEGILLAWLKKTVARLEAE
jgi:hypothetical protein